jgi:hypothetical protein
MRHDRRERHVLFNNSVTACGNEVGYLAIAIDSHDQECAAAAFHEYSLASCRNSHSMAPVGSTQKGRLIKWMLALLQF